MDRSRDPRAGRRPPLRRRLWRRLRPPRTLRPTRAGWCFFAIVLGVGFAALNTGNNLLYLVLSLMLAFLVLSGVLSETALRGIDVRRRLPGEAFAGTPAAVGLEIRNRQRRVPSFAVVVEDRVREPSGRGCAAGRVFVLRVGAGGCASRSYRLAAPRRGPLHFTGFEVSTRFPFGLFSKALRLERENELLIYPAVEPCPAPPPDGPPHSTGGGVPAAGGHAAEVSGLREFAPGDPVRRIHWRASLRRGELLVRDVESEREAEVEVRLLTEGERPGAAFERRVSRAASQVVAHLEAGRRVGLRAAGRSLPPEAGRRQRARLLAFLALVKAS